MSKLAAVRTGQPTQGVNAVPQAHPRTAAEGVAAGILSAVTVSLAASLADQTVRNAATIDDLEPPTINPRSAHSAAAATVTAAWLSLAATEMEVRTYFRSVPVPSGLEALAKMRRQCDLAAAELQQRMDDNNTERCSGCGKTLEEVRKTQFIMQGSEVDPETGVPMPYRYCGVQCVRERNREKMLPPEERNRKRFDGQPEGDIR